MNRFVLFLSLAILVGCSRPAEDPGHGHSHEDGGHAHGDDGSSWSVTAWGDRFEVYSEAAPLVEGHTASIFAHITRLSDHQPLEQGSVSAVLRNASGPDLAFRQENPQGMGIFEISFMPVVAGTFQLLFQVESQGLVEEISAGELHVGDHDGTEPFTPPERNAPSGEPVEFFKEQQWQVDFATAEVSEGVIHRVVRGPGYTRAQAGGEVVLTAPLDGVVSGNEWPHPGLLVQQGEAVFQLLPLVAADESLAELEAEVQEARADLAPAEAQLKRVEELLQTGAVSSRAVEVERGEVEAIRAHLHAAEMDLAAARSARGGSGDQAELLPLPSPITGQVSKVMVTRGEVVHAGDPLGRIVQADPIWIEVALRPGDAAQVAGNPSHVYISGIGGRGTVSLHGDDVEFISRSPEVDPITGTVDVLFQTKNPGEHLILGAAIHVEVALDALEGGVVIPESAVVDDAGVPIVYLQAGGEEFIRREIRVLGREGGNLKVQGVIPGDRIVTRGGAVIRRTSLISSGGGHGHVH